ncbi:GGDEF domain-containing protein [Niallia nealsonii]|uniref:GGDEF domain-containing protein n=2 Tax=Niallia nealsonii TaxID=115979 RepID=A0A2N0YZL0_9BACI|nr:GGDEF domain-containing protein [Niallia nealsonii]
MIFKEFFANLAILVSLLFFYSQLLYSFSFHSKSPIKLKLLAGLFGGILCNILMYYSIHVEDTLIDLRFIPTILLAYYVGPSAALISMLFTIIGRFFISVSLASYFAIVISVAVTLFAIYFSKKDIPLKVNIFYMITFNNLVFSIVLSFFVNNNILLLKVLFIYWLISYSAAYLAFYVLATIRRSQKLLIKYQRESTTDELTGLNNVRKFDEVFNKLVNELKTNKQKLSLLYIDIDFFKQVNDTYGHAAGDMVLKELGLRLQRCTRSFDIVSRNGGEEFTVLLLDCSLDRAVEIAERIRKNVEDTPFILSKGTPIHLTTSIGVACYQDTTYDTNKIIDDADKALYQAKHSGRNKVCIAK